MGGRRLTGDNDRKLRSGPNGVDARGSLDKTQLPMESLQWPNIHPPERTHQGSRTTPTLGGQVKTRSRAPSRGPTGGLRDPPHRPAQAAESKNLLLLLVIQEVAHSGEGPWARRLRQRLGRRQLMAGFAVSINGWIWVSTEATGRKAPRRKKAAGNGAPRCTGREEHQDCRNQSGSLHKASEDSNRVPGNRIAPPEINVGARRAEQAPAWGAIPAAPFIGRGVQLGYTDVRL